MYRRRSVHPYQTRLDRESSWSAVVDQEFHHQASDEPARKVYHRSRQRLQTLSGVGHYIYKGKLVPCHTQLFIFFAILGLIYIFCAEYKDNDNPIGRMVHRIVGAPKGFQECQREMIETPIDIGLPFWDTEVHFWDPIRDPRKGSVLLHFLSWMRQDWKEAIVASTTFSPHLETVLGDPAIMLRPFTITSFHESVNAHEILGVTAVESWWGYPNTMSSVHEIRWIKNQQSTTKTSDVKQSIKAIAPFVDLTNSIATQSALSHLSKQNKMIRSIRFPLATRTTLEPNPWSFLNISPLLSTSLHWRSNFAMLEHHNLAFEAFVYHTQLGQLKLLAETFPRIRIILNHAGGPFQCGSPLIECKELVEGLTEVAKCDNVLIKVSGFGMPSTGLGYSELEIPPTSDTIVNDTGGLIEHIVEVFGPQRVMFGSNFPYDKVSFPYVTILNAYKKILSKYSIQDRKRMMYENAQTVYG